MKDSNMVPKRQASVTFHPDTVTPSSHPPIMTRSRSTSTLVPPHRIHSASISSIDSVNSVALNNIIKQDSNPNYNVKGKIKLMDDIDLEKQLIITAGGKQEYVFGFILKFLLLMTIVIGSGVLIFYAL